MDGRSRGQACHRCHVRGSGDGRVHRGGDRRRGIAESAGVAPRELVDARQVLWSTYAGDGEPIEINADLYPVDDVIAAYCRIVSAPAGAWLHGEDQRGFPLSVWESPLAEKPAFLVPQIVSARVTCEHWSTPERLIALSKPRRKRVPRPDGR